MEAKSQQGISFKTTLTQKELIDRIKGCIYGCALGDAFGLSTEFMTKVSARHLYGVGPIKFGKAKGLEFWRDGHRSKWNENDFTDDTDQLLLILQCLIANKGILTPKHFAYRLLEWTKIGFPELDKPPCGIGFTVGSVLSHPEFLTNPHRAAYDVWNSKKRNLAANGAVMRTAVLGIPFFWDEAKVAQNAMNAAKVTHADPRSIVSAVIVSAMVSRMLRGTATEGSAAMDIIEPLLNQQILSGTEYETEAQPRAAPEFDSKLEPKVLQTKAKPESGGLLAKASKFFKKEDKTPGPNFRFPEHPPLDQARGNTAAEIGKSPDGMDSFGSDSEMLKLATEVVNQYRFLLSSNPLCPEDIEPTWSDELDSNCFPKSLEELYLEDRKAMGYTFKCLGAGIYASTRSIKDRSSANFFKEVITELALEAGDADTNCAVAGALLGCRFGKSGLPKDWLTGLRNSEFLEKICNELCDLVLK